MFLVKRTHGIVPSSKNKTHFLKSRHQKKKHTEPFIMNDPQVSVETLQSEQNMIKTNKSESIHTNLFDCNNHITYI